MTKGENEDLGLPSSPKGEIVGIMARCGVMVQVLSLMATHFGDRSQFRLSE